ncbi:MAG: hypothetical protein AABN95_19365 [Acidobacteriota bacterium]
MKFDATTTARLRANYKELTREQPVGLICPITLRDIPFEDLCDGHILNKALKEASRATIPQPRDLDSHFGATIEPDLVKFLNFPVLNSTEHLSKVKTLTIKLPTGQMLEGFFAGDEAAKRFGRVDLKNSAGEIVGSPYIRDNEIIGEYKDIAVEWVITVNDLALVGALIKSAYLTLFKLVGYRYALDPVGSIVRRALAGFFNDRATKQNSRNYFERFQGAVITSLKGFLNESPDTLSGGTLLFHYDDGSRHDRLFAVSTLFHVNEATLIVTLPAVMDVNYSIEALAKYERLLKDRSTRNDIHYVTFAQDTFQVSPQPMNIEYESSRA